LSSAWKVEFEESALRALKKLDKTAAKRIISFLTDRLVCRDDPRSLGRPLRGGLADYWRYRVGDYRIICQILDERLVVLVLRVAHRRESYR